MKKINQLLIFILTFSLFSCQTDSNRFDVDLSDVDIKEVRIQRYGKALFGVDRDNLKHELKNLQPQFSVFLNGDLDDTLNLIQLSDYINDTLLIALSNDCFEKYTDLSHIESELSQAFRHLKYYYPDRATPVVYSYISGFDYEFPIQYYEDNLLIALDMYLGGDYPRYNSLGVPKYVLKKFDDKYLVRDCIQKIAQSKINYKYLGNSLLDVMINEGKILYFIKSMTPDLNESILINYTDEQLVWAKKNEGNVWAFLIENNLLYSKDMQAMQKFIYDGPFTSFFGEESPSRLGWFIGWQIVSAFMEGNKNVDLSVLMKEYDAQEILHRSGYKPGI